jgi:HD-like signal output (HDOD) protein
MDPEHALLAGLIHDIGVVPVLDNAKAYPELMNNLDLLDKVIAELRGEIGALTMRLWGFGKDYMQIAVHAEDWDHLGTAIPDYLDIILLAQAHAFIGKPQVHHNPPINQLPAYFKLTDGRLTPRGSLVIVDQAKAEISAVQQILGGN